MALLPRSIVPIGLLLLVSGAAACGGSEPPVGPTLPKAEVEIMIDDRGIPHIYAQDDEDLFFAYGYQIASDRLLQLEMFRRFAHGRVSEVVGKDAPGSAGSTSLTDDRFARIFNWAHWGRQDAALMKEQEPEHYMLTSAWVAGINHRISQIAAGEVPLPYGFAADELNFAPELWTQDDPYIIQKMAGFGLDQTIQFEVFVTFVQQFAPDALTSVELFKPARQTFALPEEDRPPSASAAYHSGASSKLDPQASKLASTLPIHIGQLRHGGGSGPQTPGLASADDGKGMFNGDIAKQEKLAESLKVWSRLGHIKPLGSNNWSVNGQHTDNGMPIIAGDPHLGYAFSGIAYALHLNSKDAAGSFNTTGFSFVGAPGIFAGHNDKVAWTPTSAFADVMDMWAVTIEDGKANIGGEMIALVEREEVVTVRDGEADTFTVQEVPGYGVIMPSSLVDSPLSIAGSGKEVLVGWTGFRARTARYFRELMRVQSIDEFDEAVMRLPEMTYNFMAADASGITYRVGVEVPDRNSLAPTREPYRTMDAADPLSFWTDKRLSPEQLPSTRASERGWIVTANNDPWGFTADGRVDNDPWYYGGIFPPGWRAGRIEQELTRMLSEGKVDVAKMQQLQMDVHSNLSDDMVPMLTEAWTEAQTDTALADFVSNADNQAVVQLITQDWDQQMRRDSPGALAFHAFAHFAAAAVMEDDLSPLLFETVLNAAPMYLLKIAALALKGEYPNGDGVMQEGRNAIVMEAVANTSAFLIERFGGTDPSGYQFSDMRVSNMDHAYGRGMLLPSIATPGGESTVNVAQAKFRQDGVVLDQWISNWGPIERQVMNFDANGTPQSVSNFPLGNVADATSPYFDNSMNDWIEGDYKPMWFARDEVQSAAQVTVKLPAVAQ